MDHQTLSSVIYPPAPQRQKHLQPSSHHDLGVVKPYDDFIDYVFPNIPRGPNSLRPLLPQYRPNEPEFFCHAESEKEKQQAKNGKQPSWLRSRVLSGLRSSDDEARGSTFRQQHPYAEVNNVPLSIEPMITAGAKPNNLRSLDQRATLCKTCVDPATIIDQKLTVNLGTLEDIKARTYCPLCFLVLLISKKNIMSLPPAPRYVLSHQRKASTMLTSHYFPA
ncbi:hypothetical protein EJ08DRAFT_691359 [Tothia fuscella]|uniref:Uncharacterized protein n=1 Tax=Tothia fuscella TaxID=1048955 RepID=A0A9P4P424_9PEZI|nr:hypothetical protein EJ08DRAFT_691359 [Tothia fuscella]